MSQKKLKKKLKIYKTKSGGSQKMTIPMIPTLLSQSEMKKKDYQSAVMSQLYELAISKKMFFDKMATV